MMKKKLVTLFVGVMLANAVVAPIIEVSAANENVQIVSQTGQSEPLIIGFYDKNRWDNKQINVKDAWNTLNKTNSTKKIKIAVIDCGVQMNHPALQNILDKKKSVDITQKDTSKNYKLLTSLKDKDSAKGQYTGTHGTKVTGVLASMALGFDKNKCPYEVMVIKCDATYNDDLHISKSFLPEAIRYAVNNGANVINISYVNYTDGRDPFTQKEKEKLNDRIQWAIDKNVCIVAAAGNHKGTKPNYPAAFSGVIGVGATDRSMNVSSYSNTSEAVDIYAPGGDTDARNWLCLAFPTTMGKKTGYIHGYRTSYATPHVTATVAMMLSVNPKLTPAEVQKILQKTAQKNSKGKKVLDAGAAVKKAAAGN